MNFELLKKLINIHSVAGDEAEIEDFLVDFAKKNKLNYTYNKGYGVVIGNPNAKIYCIAHIDEVGGKITKIKGQRLKFKGIGWVNPDMFVGRDIEIKTEKNNEYINGIITAKKPLKTNYNRFGDLEIIIDSTEVNKIKVGNFLRYKSYYKDKENSIFSTSLDNKISVFTLLNFIIENKNDKKLLENIAFCFATEEEIKNKGAKYFMKKYKPEKILIFDMVPETFIKNNYSTNTFILKKSPDYDLDKYFIDLLEKNSKISYINSVNNKLLKNSEPFQYQNITKGKAINILCPIFNYHHGTYMLEKETYNNFYEFTKNIIENISKK